MALYTIKEVAEQLHCSRVHVGRLLKWNKLRGVQLENEWIIDGRSVQAYLDRKGGTKNKKGGSNNDEKVATK